MYFQKLDSEKAEELEIKLPTPLDHRKSKGIPKNICFIDYAKTFDCDHCCGSQQTVENSPRDGIPDHPTCLLRNLYGGQEALELDVE